MISFTTKEHFETRFAELQSNFNRKISPSQAQYFWKKLKNWPEHEFDKACDEILRTCDSFPKWKQFHAYQPDLSATTTLPPSYEECKRAWSKGDDQTWVNEQIERIVNPEQYCKSYNHTHFIVKQFNENRWNLLNEALKDLVGEKRFEKWVCLDRPKTSVPQELAKRFALPGSRNITKTGLDRPPETPSKSQKGVKAPF